MTGFEVNVSGIREATSKFAKARVATPQVAALALKEEADLIFRITQVQVPVRFGILKGSGGVSQPSIAGTKIQVTISYGGAASAYAYVMERGYNFTRSGRRVELHYNGGKKAHYLEDPVAAAIPFMARRLAMRMQEMINSG